MEDDGLLMNFEMGGGDVVEPSKNRKTKVAGGRWKDRRKLQLKLLGRGRNDKNSGAVTGSNTTAISNKKRNIGGGGDDVPKFSGGGFHKKAKFQESGGEFGGKNNSYVSSLFHANDKSGTLKPTTTKDDDDTKHSPSNAPLTDSTSFEGLGINNKLNTHLTEYLRLKTPTRIQQAVIPNFLGAQRDLFVKAQTGSGKTLSFLLPILHQLMQERVSRDSGVFAIVLTPTRELATQIHGVLESLVRCHHSIVPGIVIGGEKKKSEKARIRKGVNVLIGTPGRLADHLENTSALDISQLRWLVLDEGDRLVDLGFEETITKITDEITKKSKIMDSLNQWPSFPTRRVNVLCSATIQDNVKKLGSIILNKPQMINIEANDDTDHGTVSFDDDGPTEDIHTFTTAPDQLVQSVVVVPPKLRLVTLSALLKKLSSGLEDNDEASRSLVFFSCSDSVDFHFNVFTRGGKRFKKVKGEDKVEYVAVDPEEDDKGDKDEPSLMSAPILGTDTVVFKLHGSLTQQARTSTLQSLIKNHSKAKHAILLCTDVASRGLDLPNITNVIEYDPPFSVEDHLHRIGRSARVGKSGSASLFLLPGSEEGYVDGKLRSVHPNEGSLKIVSYEGILKDGFSLTSDSKVSKHNREGNWDTHATTYHLDIERWLLEDQTQHEKASNAFISHIRAYTTHLSSERAYFNVKLLHLGHLAKSFGLREAPKKLGKGAGSHKSGDDGTTKQKKEDPRKKMLRMAKMAVASGSSEFNY